MSDLSTLTLDAALSQVSEWVDAQQYEQAIQHCNELLAVYPAAVRAIRARAQALEASGEPAPASDDYRRVLEILPTDDTSLLGLARCLAATDQHSEAATLARQVLDYAPQNAEALQIAGDALTGKAPEGLIDRSRNFLKGGITARAITLMRRLNEAEPDRADVQALLAEILWRNGVRITTAELCQAILDDQPDCLNAHVLLSAIWAQAGNADLEALHHRAIEPLDPDYRQTYLWLGNASPLQPRDVPALPNAPAPENETPAHEPAEAQPSAEEGDPDRSAWVDDLIASSGPVTPLPPQEAPATAPADSSVAESEVYAGEVTTTSPLEWAPAETDHVSAVDESMSELPQWLRDLQASAARAPAIEEPEPPVTPARDEAEEAVAQDIEEEAAAEDEMDAEAEPAPPIAGDVYLDEETGWAPVTADEPAPDEPKEEAASGVPADEAPTAEPEEAAEEPVEAPLAEEVDAEAPAEQFPVESNPAPAVADVPPPVKPVAPARKHGHKGKGKSSKARPGNDEILAQARKALEAGRYDEAADHYGNLISAGKKLDVVLADLDVATHAYPDVRRFHGLLGDVYTRKGDVNAALAAYHRALESH
jgi:tetratricopeptide (TPR) repeat protein